MVISQKFLRIAMAIFMASYSIFAPIPISLAEDSPYPTNEPQETDTPEMPIDYTHYDGYGEFHAYPAADGSHDASTCTDPSHHHTLTPPSEETTSQETSTGEQQPEEADTTAPNISAVTATQIKYNQATITWTTNETSDSKVSYGLTTSYGTTTPVNTSLVTSHSVVLSGLQENTTYNYQVTSCDKFNNCRTSGNFTFKTPVAPDVTGPVISAVTITDINSGSANLTWATNEASNGLVEYWIGTSAKSTTTLDTSLGTSQSASLRNLMADTTYNYRAKSCDAANNCTYSATLTFKTLPSSINTTTPVMTLNKPLVNVVNENQTFSIVVSGTDPQSDVLTYLINGNPTGSTFITASDKKSATFSWTPSYTQNGVYTITFHVTDGIETTAVTITITVNDIDGPVTVGGIEVDQIDNDFTVAGYQIYEGSGYRKVTYSIDASDPDQKVFNWSWSYKLNGGPEITMLQGSGTVPDFTMDYGGQPGTYEIIFRGDDGVSFKSQTFTTEVLAGTWASNALPTLFIDFDGGYVGQWGSYTPDTIPRFDQDSDNSSYSASELTTMANILIGVIEKFAIFGLWVTALDPFLRIPTTKTYVTPQEDTEEFNDRSAFYTANNVLAVMVGDSTDWYTTSGGVAYVDSFSNDSSTMPNYVFVFDNKLGGSTTNIITAISHESGHAFGLRHQALYDDSGNKIDDYSKGVGGVAPVMGYYAGRNLWWYGTNNLGPTWIQDDVGVITKTANGITLKADEYGNDISSAFLLPFINGTVSGVYGIINDATDVDYLKFTLTTGGSVTFNANGAAFGQMLDIKLEIRDSNGNVIATADPGTIISSTNLDATITATLSAGTYYLVVSGHGLIDLGGNYGSGYDVGQYWIDGTIPISGGDTTAPTISALAFSNVTFNAATITWTTNEASDSMVQYRIQGTSTWTSTTLNSSMVTSHTVTLTGLNSSSVYEFQALSKDAAANLQTSNVLTFTTPDVTAPVISALTSANVTATGATITWTTNEASDTQVQYRKQGDSTWTSTTLNSSMVTSHSVTLTGLNSTTVYEFRALSKDAAGNLQTSTVLTFTTLDPPDVTAPVISVLTSSSITSTGATVTWTTNEASDTQVQYRVQGTSTWTSTTLVSTMLTSHSVTLSGLSSSTVYEFRALSKDAAGNLQTSNVATFTTLAPPDITAPVISALTSSSVTSTGATISWTTNEASDTQVQYRVQGTTTWTSTTLNTSMITSHSVTLTGLSSDTIYEFQALSKDAASNLQTSSVSTFSTPDITAPVISALTSSSITSTGVMITWTTNEASDTQLQYRVEGTSTWISTTLNASMVTSHSVTLMGLSSSTVYEFRALSKDAAGNLQTSNILTFTTLAPPDVTAPVISSLTSSSITSTGATITWTTNEASDTQVQYRIQGTTTWTSTTLNTSMVASHSVNLTGLNSNTVYEFRALSKDVAGNLQTSNVLTFTTPDVTAPAISALTSSSITATGATISWTTNEPSDTQVQYRVQGTSTWTSTTLNSSMVTSHSVTLTGLSSQTIYEFQALSKDVAGNLQTSSVLTFATPDISAPVISSLTSSSITVSGATISWTTNEAGDTQVQYRVQGTLTWISTTLNTSMVTNHSVTLSGLNAGTTYEFRALSKDTAGNLQTSNVSTLKTLDLPDTTAPVISSLTSSSVTATEATITWTTNEASDTQVQYRVQGSSTWTSTTLNSSMLTSHSVTLSGLNFETTYEFRALSKDAVGNLQTSNVLTFKTSDVTAPAISALAFSNITSTGATISWTTNEASDTQVQYRVQGTSTWTSTTLNTSMVISHSVTLTGLSSETVYEFQALSKDATGNLQTSNVLTFATPDVTAPAISALTSSNVTATAATISWTTNEGSDTQVQYRVQGTSSWTSTTLNTSMVTSHSVNLTGLNSETIYEYQVLSKDAAGNQQISNVLTFTTPDVTAPVISALTSTSITATGAIITWMTNEASDTQVEYRVQGTSTWVSTTLNTSMVTNHSVTLTGLNSGTVYEFRVLSRDIENNLQTSNILTFSTLDITAPAISALVSTGITSTGVTITWTTNEISDTQLQYRIQGTTTWTSTTLNTSLLTSHSVALTGLNSSTIYEFRALSKDAAGNLQTSNVLTFTTLDPPDITAPVISALTSSNISATGAMITWTTNEASDTQIQYRVQGTTTWISTTLNTLMVTNHSVTLTGLTSETIYEFRALSKDAAGNLQTSNVLTFTTPDVTAPTISALTSTNVTATGAIITWTTNEGSDTQVQYRVLGTSTWTSTTLNTSMVTIHSVTLTGLASETVYEFRALSKDRTGNLQTSTVLTFTTPDITAPTITNVVSNNITAASATITWTTNEGSTSLIEYGTTSSYGETSDLDSTLLTNHSLSLSSLTSDTVYHFRVKSCDTANNCTYSADFTFKTPDISAPVISQITSSSITGNSAKITWTTNEASNSLIEYGLDLSYGSSTTVDSTMVTSHSMNLSGLQDGVIYHYRVKSCDASVPANCSYSADFTFTTPDVTAPAINNVTTNNITASSVTISWATNEGSNSLIEFGLDSTYGSSTTLNVTLLTSHSMTLTGLDDNTVYHFRAKSCDSTGNCTYSGDFTFKTPDATAPVLRGVPNAEVQSNSATITWVTDETSNSWIEYGLDSTYGNSTTLDTTLVTNHSMDLSGLADGTTYHYRIISCDGVGNCMTSADFIFTTPDVTAPVISLVTAGQMNADSAVITWTTNEAGTSWIEYGTTSSYGQSTTVDSTKVISHSMSLTGLDDNTTYHFRVRSCDDAGNCTVSADFIFKTPDATAPVVTSVTASNIKFDSATITWTTDELSDSWVEFGLDSTYGDSVTLAALVQNHSINVTGLDDGQVYHFRVKSCDSAVPANCTYSADFTFTTPDVTPPGISGVTLSDIQANSAKIIWTTNEGGTSWIEYGLTSNYTDSTTVDKALVTSHSMDLSGLKDNSVYHYRVTSCDGANNCTVSADFTFTTPDATAPIITVVVSKDIKADSATITWTTNEASTSWIEYGLTSSYGEPPVSDETKVTTHSLTLIGLDDNTVYHFRVTSCDASNNCITSADFTFKTPDATAPLITLVATSQIKFDSAKISWKTDEASNSLIEYGTDTNYGMFSTLDENLVTNHSISLLDLNDGTVYHFRVKSCDSAIPANCSYSEDFTFKTPDVTPPVITDVVITEITGGSVTITWNTDDASDSLIQIGLTSNYGDETDIDDSSVTSHSMTISGLSSETVYHFRVKSCDDSNNCSFSQDFTFKTLDITAPVVSSVASSNITGNSATISWTTNEASNSWIEYGTTLSYGESTPVDETDVTNHLMLLTNLKDATVYHFRVKSCDDAGNCTYSADFTFTTPDITPPIVSFLTVSDVNGNSATITWLTNEGSTSWIEYGTDITYGIIKSDETLVTDHSLNLSELKDGTTYHFRIRSCDGATPANCTYSVDYTFQTPDITPPVINSVASSDIQFYQATISWNTNEASNSLVEFGTTDPYGNFSILDEKMITDHSLIIEGLDGLTLYHFRVRSCDSSGNCSFSSDVVFTTPEVTAPVIVSVETSGASSSSLTISWSMEGIGDATIEYGLTPDLGNTFSPENAPLASDQTISLTGLQTSTMYYYRILSCVLGKCTSSETFTFKTSDKPFDSFDNLFGPYAPQIQELLQRLVGKGYDEKQAKRIAANQYKKKKKAKKDKDIQARKEQVYNFFAEIISGLDPKSDSKGLKTTQAQTAAQAPNHDGNLPPSSQKSS